MPETVVVAAGVGGGLDTANQARVFNSAAISIPNNANTALTFDSERFNPGAMHSLVSNTGRLTALQAGVYMIGGHVSFASLLAATVLVGVRVNGATLIAFQQVDTQAGANTAAISITTLYKLAANDYVELIAYQNSGAAVNVNATGNYSPEFWAQRVG